MANDFSGAWQFCHWYPSVDDAKEECGEYDMVGHQNGHSLVLESVKDDKKDAYLLVRLHIDGNVASGSWHEKADTHGPFSGTDYSGAGQLIISDDGTYMDGMWAGVGFDHAANQPKMYTGRWELKRKQ